MDQVRLGPGGPTASRLGLGTALFGTRVGTEAADGLVSRFLASGGTLIDTADVYGREGSEAEGQGAGASERMLGEVLQGRRSRVFLATKVGQGARFHPGADEVGLSPERIRRQVESSLRRLRTDWIDLYQCHLWDPYTPVVDSLGALSDLVAEGKIRYVGVSNWDGWQVVDAAGTTAVPDAPSIVSNQVWYNLIDRRIENSVVPACHQAGVAVIAYGALAQGFLTGGYRREGPLAAGARLAPEGLLTDRSWAGLATARGWRILETVIELARDLGLSPSVVALRWLLDAGRADVALIGPRDDAQLADLLHATDAVLPREALARLTEMTEPEMTYPRAFTEMYARRESPYFGGMVEPPRVPPRGDEPRPSVPE